MSRKLLLTSEGIFKLLPPRSRWAGPEKPEGVPRRTWQALFSPRTSRGTRLLAALAVVRLLTMGRGPAWMSFHTTIDVAGLKAARQEIESWAKWKQWAALEGNPQLSGEYEDDPVELVGIDEVVMSQFEELARANGVGIIEFLVTLGMEEIERRK